MSSTITTKHLILDAAARQFSNFGYGKVTMGEIARDAGIGKASIYYYFPKKERLFEAVVEREHLRFMERLQRKTSATNSSSERIRLYVVERCEYFYALVHLNILELKGVKAMKPIFSGMALCFAERERTLLRNIVKEGMGHKEFHTGPADMIAKSILHVMEGLRHRRVRSMTGVRFGARDYSNLKQESCFVAELFLRGMKTKGFSI